MGFLDEVAPKICNSEYKKANTITVINGDVKSGKTTLACSANEVGNTLLVNCEGMCRLSHIPEIEDKLRFYPFDGTILNISTMDWLITTLNKNKDKHNLKYVVIDTIDALFENVKIEKYKQRSISWEERDFIKLKTINFIIDLVTDCNVDVIVTSHDKKDEKTSRQTMALSKDLCTKLNRKISSILYLDKNLAGQRELHLRNHPFFQCEISIDTEKRKKIEGINSIVNPVWNDFIKLYE